MTNSQPYAAILVAVAVLLAGCGGFLAADSGQSTPTATPTQTPDGLDAEVVEQTLVSETGVENISVTEQSDGYNATIDPRFETADDPVSRHSQLLMDMLNVSVKLDDRGDLGTLRFRLVADGMRFGSASYCVNETMRSDYTVGEDDPILAVKDVAISWDYPEWCQ